MRGAKGERAIAAVLIASILLIGIPVSGNETPVIWGASGTHSSGNFSITIGDDGGYTSWDTLEFPIGQDRLTGGSFGLGSSPSTVDFGLRHDLVTVDLLSIRSPGNWTDEEGFCSFTGESGQDFDDVKIVQRTYMNDFNATVPNGHTGRWLVVDYNISAPAPRSDVLIIQMLDVDLGTATDDLFSYDVESGITSIHQGTTFIGLTYYNMNRPNLHGHNAGLMTSSVFDGEDAIYDHMSSPNNATTSATQQNWYMDHIVRIPAGTFPGHVHIAFAILVGDSMSSLGEALEDARAGLRGRWDSDPPQEWIAGDIEVQASYAGLYPPADPVVEITPVIGGIPGAATEPPFDLFGNDLRIDINTSSFIPDHGSIDLTIESTDPCGHPSEGGNWSILCDNRGPDVIFDHPTGWLKEKYQVIASADDRGGSGVSTIYISGNGETFRAAHIATVQVEGGDNDVRAYAVDAVGNAGPMFSVDGLKLDMTPPSITIGTSPTELDEDIVGPITVTATVQDSLSGVDPSTVMFRYGLEGPTFPWSVMEKVGDRFEAEIDLSWEASQELDLHIEIKASDMAGNQRLSTADLYISPLNDPPEMVMEVFSDEWESRSVVLFFNGSDPDGDDLTYLVEYDIGAGWTDATDLVSRLSANRYGMEVPDIEYEGPMSIRSTVSDGEVNITLPARSVNIDRKAPLILVSIEPTGYWSRTARTLSIELTDGGSGPGKSYFRDGPTTLQGPDLSLSREGVHEMLAIGTDASGNEARFEIPEFGIDLTPPVMGGVTMTPAEFRSGEDLRMEFECWDNISGIERIVSEMVSGEIRLPGTVGSAGTDRYRIDYEDIALGPGSEFRVLTTLTDEAGNSLVHDSGPMTMERDPDLIPIDVTAPSSIDVMEDFDMVVEFEGEISFMAIYPGLVRGWILPETRKEGDIRTFSLPGPSHGERISISLSYSEEGKPRFFNLSITITNWTDEDLDGLDDTWERKYGLDPTRADDGTLDEDGDGLSLVKEMVHLTDPGKEDTDGDGLPDEWEALSGTLPFRADQDEDPDGDGYTNLVEHLRRTDPRDPLSHPKEPHATPWYWIVLILVFFLAVIAFFVYQMIGRKKVEDELERVNFEEEGEVWDEVET